MKKEVVEKNIGMTHIKSVIKKIVPDIWIKKICRQKTKWWDISRQKKLYEKKIKTLKNKNRINIVFLLINADIWKYHELYLLLKKNEKYNPVVVICPIMKKGEKYLKKNYTDCAEFCEERNYQYLHGYDLNLKRSIDVNKNVDVDIVLFGNPNTLSPSKIGHINIDNCLACYMPYSFRIDTLYEYCYNKPFLNLMWRNFYESNIHKKLAAKHAMNGGENVVVTGFPKIDELRKSKGISGIWQNSDKKKIVWAPHWTIKGFQNTGINWSCFLDYCEDIFEIAKYNSDKIEVALKPHPFLFNLLEKDNLWGKEKTKKYFEKWQKNENTHLVQGDYVELLASSDALIHDSGSFLVEYLVFDKPVAYTVSNGDDLINRFNEFGKLAINEHHKIYNKQELKNFFLTVIKGDDPLAESRKSFRKKYLEIKGNSAAENIVEELNNHFI